MGGTHASRMIHRESNQLILGPYFIDAAGNVRAADLQQLRGRMTAVMRHLTDPADWVYFFDMEGAIYEVQVHTLEVRRLFTKPVPGWHGKGGYTAQGRVVIANNGESGNPAAYRDLLVGGPAQGEEAGVLAEWDGEEWRIVERKKFLDVTGPGGLYGNPNDQAQLWAFGWDKRSVLLKLLDTGRWSTFRLPKASHTYDPSHGWYTEWPRIREIVPGQPMMLTHGAMFDFPIDFREGATGGIRPIATLLRYVPDFGYWDDRIFLGSDDASMMQNPLCGQAQSNIWFGQREDLDAFGPRTGWGGVWMNDPVRAGEPSDPFLFEGYRHRILHLAHDHPQPVTFSLEVDRRGGGDWTPLTRIEVPAAGYRFHLFRPRDRGEWIRVVPDRNCTASAYLHAWSPRNGRRGETRQFAALAEAGSPIAYTAGIIRPAAHNRGLQWLSQVVDADGQAQSPVYREVLLEGVTTLQFIEPVENRTAEVLKVGEIRPDFELDAASVIVTDSAGKRWRLPRGHAAFDQPFPTGWPRGVREAVSERFLANLHGTFYEIPRDARSRPDFGLLKPVASHNRIIHDFCTWRGLLVLSGARIGAPADGHFFANPGGAGLWFGSIDDLWQLGKPVGQGGPWRDTAVRAGEPSDPYLMTGYDRKEVTLSHDASRPVRFDLEIDFDHQGFHAYTTILVPPGRTVQHRFPNGFHAHWIRLTIDQDCRASALFRYL